MRALVLAEHDGVQLLPVTLNVVTAATMGAGEVDLLVAGKGLGELAQAAAQIAGLAKVLVADGDSLADGLAPGLAAQVMTLASGYSHFFFASTSTGKSVGPRVAALLDVAQISDATKIIDADTFQRSTYAGNVIATVRSLDAQKVVTVRATAFTPAATAGGHAVIEPVAAIVAQVGSSLLGRELVKNERPDLAVAKAVVSGGRALGSAEQFTQVLTPLADRLGAALGASRAAVDSGYAPNDWQVGQTGKVVAPNLYVAVGISGAIQHLAGMKDSKIIVAINKDAEAPIFSIADCGLQADLFEAVPALTSLL